MHVVIIGAGVAGLSAARHLLQENNGNIEVTLVEANDYIGGRIKTDRSFLYEHLEDRTTCNNCCHGVDLGAEFVHGGGSVLHNLVMQQKNWKTEDIFITAQGDGGPDNHPTKDHGKYGSYWIGKENRFLLYSYVL